MPVHYGYWDASEAQYRCAADEFTHTDVDVASKQPGCFARSFDGVTPGYAPAHVQ